MMLNSTAYCVMFIDRPTGKIKGIGIFSEPTPTARDATVVWQEVGGVDFADAHRRAIRWLDEDPLKAWLRDLGLWTARRSKALNAIANGTALVGYPSSCTCGFDAAPGECASHRGFFG